MIFCHKTHFCGRYSAPDLRQTGGPGMGWFFSVTLFPHFVVLTSLYRFGMHPSPHRGVQMFGWYKKSTHQGWYSGWKPLLCFPTIERERRWWLSAGDTRLWWHLNIVYLLSEFIEQVSHAGHQYNHYVCFFFCKEFGLYELHNQSSYYTPKIKNQYTKGRSSSEGNVNTRQHKKVILSHTKNQSMKGRSSSLGNVNPHQNFEAFLEINIWFIITLSSTVIHILKKA